MGGSFAEAGLPFCNISNLWVIDCLKVFAFSVIIVYNNNVIRK